MVLWGSQTLKSPSVDALEVHGLLVKKLRMRDVSELILKAYFFFFLFFFLNDFIYLCLERGEGREENINWLPVVQPQPGTWPTTQACALTGN